MANQTADMVATCMHFLFSNDCLDLFGRNINDVYVIKKDANYCNEKKMFRIKDLF